MDTEAITALVHEARSSAAAAVVDSLAAPVAEYNSLLLSVQNLQAALIAQLEALRLELAAAVAKSPHAAVGDNFSGPSISKIEASTMKIETLKHRLHRVSSTLQNMAGRMAALQGAVTVYEQAHATVKTER